MVALVISAARDEVEAKVRATESDMASFDMAERREGGAATIVMGQRFCDICALTIWGTFGRVIEGKNPENAVCVLLEVCHSGWCRHIPAMIPMTRMCLCLTSADPCTKRASGRPCI